MKLSKLHTLNISNLPFVDPNGFADGVRRVEFETLDWTRLAAARWTRPPERLNSLDFWVEFAFLHSRNLGDLANGLREREERRGRGRGERRGESALPSHSSLWENMQQFTWGYRKSVVVFTLDYWDNMCGLVGICILLAELLIGVTTVFGYTL